VREGFRHYGKALERAVLVRGTLKGKLQERRDFGGKDFRWKDLEGKSSAERDLEGEAFEGRILGSRAWEYELESKGLGGKRAGQAGIQEAKLGISGRNFQRFSNQINM
jgi:hypothetical protein